MKILIEQFGYGVEVVENLLPKKFITYQSTTKASVDLVGYYNNFEKDETIIILPKIFLDEKNKCVFGNIPVGDFTQENCLEVLRNNRKSTTDIDFIYRFAFVFYLSLREFQARNPKNEITELSATKNIISNIENTAISELDLVLSLLKFYQDNKDLVIFKAKETQKQTQKNTNWTKTTQRNRSIIQNNIPIYTETYQKNNIQNSDDELLKIFFGLLYHFKQTFGFHISLENIHVGKNNFTKNHADFYEKSFITLKRLKNTYFVDKFKKLLFLLIAYFEKKQTSNTKEQGEEFILCKNYNIVFEDMIDKLLSDEGKIIEKMKNQEDGKIIDHIFQYPSFFNPDTDNIYYIGDAKYYKETTQYSKNSIYKQHTYAKNIIQYNVNLFNENQINNSLRYRDNLTEGYNITPNFFIQGFIDHQNITDFTDNFRIESTQNPKINYHFENRIFDRDTLFVYNFNINFVFVLQSYIEKSQNTQNTFKDKTKQTIKTEIWKYIINEYEFYYLDIPNKEEFIQENFKCLIGKIYQDSKQEKIIIGLKKNHNESQDIKQKFSSILNN